MSQALLSLKVEAKEFDALRVLDQVGLTVRQGEVVSLVGPSGCGKSTLLRIVAGLDIQYSGDVLVNGKAPQQHSRDVGFIFQEPRLLPWLTVAENVGFAAGKGGSSHPRVRELLAEVGLADFANAYPKQLSGGMAQRAAIARGLFSQPSLLLLDEPFSAVDAFTRMHLQKLLLSIAAKHGTTLLLVTHDVNEAVYLSNRVVVLACNPGRIKGEVHVDLPRARSRGDQRLSGYEAEVLNLLRGDEARDLEHADDPAEQLAASPAKQAAANGSVLFTNH